MTAVDKDWEVQLTFADTSADPTQAFAQVFPLNPCRQGLMRSYNPDTGNKDPVTIKQPVTLNDVRRNMSLSGHAGRLGFLAGEQDGTTVGMIDIDLKNFANPGDMRKVVDDVTAALKRAQFACHEETSTNGGAHLWIFLSESVPYQLMTDVLKVFTAEARHPSLETYPVGDKGAEGKWVYMPYAGAEQDEDRLGLTYLRDPENGWPIPAWALAQAVQRVSVGSFLAVLARKPHVPQQDAKQTASHDLAPDGYALLVAATLNPPAGFERHNSAEAFLNLAERMGKQDDMAEHLKSEAMYATWVADESRTREAWAKEIDRWREGDSERQYGITFLTDQGWDIPDLPKPGAQTTQKGKQNWQQAFESLRSKYVTDEHGNNDTRRIRRYRAHELSQIPQLEPLVGSLLVQRTLAALLGPSGAGKSMIGLDLALHIAEGREWHGQTVAAGPVVWLAAESMEYTANRMEAWCDRYGVKPERLAFDMLDGYLALTDVQPDGGLEDLILTMKDIESERGALRLIVIDTVARTFGDGDENSNDDMKHFTDAAELLTRIFNATVLLVHHTGKDTARGGRGASAFKAPLTTELIVEKKASYVELRQTKSRGAPEYADTLKLTFETHSWEINGTERKAGVVAQGDIKPQFAPDLLPEKQRIAYEALAELCADTDDKIAREDWRNLAASQGCRESTFRDAVRALVSEGYVQEFGKGKQLQYRTLEDE